MARRGVKSISGPSAPSIGQPAIYRVSEWHPETPNAMKANVKWELFKKRESGQYTTTNIIKTGPLGTFTFGERAANEDFKVEGYLFNPELNGPTTLNVTPSQGPPSISTITMLNYKGERFTSTPQYGQNIVISIDTVNMIGEDLTIGLWERDTISDEGHDTSDNTKLWETEATIENSNGNVKVQKQLTLDMAINANNNIFEGGTHEYYVVVKSNKSNQYNYSEQELEVSSNTSNYEVNSAIQEALQVNGITNEIVVENGNSPSVVGDEGEGTNNCEEQFCIKIGDKSELVREVNIRLAGFGGNVPTDEFTSRTETMIKQFQKDYMEIPETGKICGNLLRAIDTFEARFPIVFEELKCPCGTCSGFGQGQFSVEKQDSSIAERYRKYEYPGIHRSLLWSYKALMFYLTKKEGGIYSINKISSGYRCHVNNAQKGRTSTNHMGKAIDIHFNKNNNRTRVLSDIETIRDNILIPTNNAQIQWSSSNLFSLEPSRNASFTATTWIHLDVRQFDLEYLEDQYFANTFADIKGKSIIEVARENGHAETCDCMSAYTPQDGSNSNPKSWAHSPFGNIIAEKESNNDYNICNRTVGGLSVVRNVTVVNTKIREIQAMQGTRAIFAVGRYQIIPITLNEAIAALNLDVNLNMDEEIQDQIFEEFLIDIKRPEIIAYLEGNGSIGDAMWQAAREWASIGVEAGRPISKGRIAVGGESYYAGDGLNRAHISPEQIRNALTQSKNENQ